MCDQVHAKDLAGDLLRFLRALSRLHTTTLAATAGMNLGLNDNHRRGQFFGRVIGLFD